MSKSRVRRIASGVTLVVFLDLWISYYNWNWRPTAADSPIRSGIRELYNTTLEVDGRGPPTPSKVRQMLYSERFAHLRKVCGSNTYQDGILLRCAVPKSQSRVRLFPQQRSVTFDYRLLESGRILVEE